MDGVEKARPSRYLCGNAGPFAFVPSLPLGPETRAHHRLSVWIGATSLPLERGSTAFTPALVQNYRASFPADLEASERWKWNRRLQRSGTEVRGPGLELDRGGLRVGVDPSQG